MNRGLLLAGVLIAALLASYGVLATAEGSTRRAGAGGGAIPGPWVLENVRLHEWEGSTQTLDARAARIEVRPKRAGLFTIPMLREARVSELDARVTRTGGRTTRVRAERARFDPLRPFWLLEGNARVEEAGTLLACAKLKWDPASGPLPSSRCRPVAPLASVP